MRVAGPGTGQKEVKISKSNYVTNEAITISSLEEGEDVGMGRRGVGAAVGCRSGAWEVRSFIVVDLRGVRLLSDLEGARQCSVFATLILGTHHHTYTGSTLVVMRPALKSTLTHWEEACDIQFLL